MVLGVELGWVWWELGVGLGGVRVELGWVWVELGVGLCGVRVGLGGVRGGFGWS